jgi:hypothetical protein
VIAELARAQHIGSAHESRPVRRRRKLRGPRTRSAAAPFDATPAGVDEEMS